MVKKQSSASSRGTKRTSRQERRISPPVDVSDFKSDLNEIKSSFGGAKGQISLLLNAVGLITQGVKLFRGSENASPSALAKNATAIAEKNPRAGLFTAAGVTLALAGLIYYRDFWRPRSGQAMA